ncbi:hypothetical protein FKP32DRAFT_1601398 [Trametes sanguinea]|nr:hypothetical protein FKP32DRAFT_1601398 [Trametes sanguinea]
MRAAALASKRAIDAQQLSRKEELLLSSARIVDRGIRIAFWWTRFVPDFSADEALLAMEKGDAELAASLSVSPTPTATAVASTVVSAVVAASSASRLASGEDDPALAEGSVVPPVTESLPLAAIPDPALAPRGSGTTSSEVAPPPTATSQHDEL